MLRSNAWIFGLFVGIVSAVAWAVGELSGAQPYVAGALMGGAVVASVGSIWMFVVMASGTAPQMMGDLGEQWTAGELRDVRGRDWYLINHLLLAQQDIDHVMIGPAGAYIFETKWSSRCWDDDEGVTRQRHAINQVLQASRQLRLWHEFKRRSVPVYPVVVLWGRGLQEWDESRRVREVDGVHVVTGHALADWFRDRTAGDASVDAATRVRVCEAVAAQARLRDAREIPAPLSIEQ